MMNGRTKIELYTNGAWHSRKRTEKQSRMESTAWKYRKGNPSLCTVETRWIMCNVLQGQPVRKLFIENIILRNEYWCERQILHIRLSQAIDFLWFRNLWKLWPFYLILFPFTILYRVLWQHVALKWLFQRCRTISAWYDIEWYVIRPANDCPIFMEKESVLKGTGDKKEGILNSRNLLKTA